MDGVWGEKRGEVVAGLLCRDWVGGWVDGWLAGQEDMAGWGGGERDGWWIACMDFGAGNIAFTRGEKTSKPIYI